MSGLLVAGKIQTLLDRLTATRAGYLDAAITSRASAANLTTLTNNVATVDANVDAIKAATDVALAVPTSIVGVSSTEVSLSGLFDSWADSTGSVAVGAVQNQWYTVDSYTGSGVIRLMSIVAGEALSANYQARLLIDGTAVYTSATNGWASGAGANDGFVIVGSTPGGAAGLAEGNLTFGSSFSLQARCTSAGAAKNFVGYRVYYTMS